MRSKNYTTYAVETADQKDIVAYFDTLHQAKQYVIKFFDKHYCILCIKGPYYAEGWHKYRLYLRNNLTFKRETY